MAHPCCSCGSECYCSGDIDDVIVSHTPVNCETCGCHEFWDGEGDHDDSWDDEYDGFEPCDKCDDHDACADFGCAFKLGVGHLVKKDPTTDFD